MIAAAQARKASGNVEAKLTLEQQGAILHPAILTGSETGRFDKTRTAAVVNAMPQEGDPSNDRWLDLGVSSALEGAARDEFAVAADFAALVYTMLGRSAQAADAADVAARLRAGEPGGNFPQLRSAVLLGAFQEIQHRQTEHQRDVESLMQRIGQQPRE